MTIAQQLAKHFRDVHFGGNWTVSSLQQHTKDLTWQQATADINGYNSIAVLVVHTSYFVNVLKKVLLGGPLEGNDTESFILPNIASQEDWNALLENIWRDAEETAKLIELMPDQQLSEVFKDNKYGTYYRNIQGIIEHMHYHLGQIVLLKKML